MGFSQSALWMTAVTCKSVVHILEYTVVVCLIIIHINVDMDFFKDAHTQLYGPNTVLQVLSIKVFNKNIPTKSWQEKKNFLFIVSLPYIPVKSDLVHKLQTNPTV